MRELVCDPKAETLGIHFLAFFSNLQEHQTRPIMEKHGLTNIERDQWVPTRKMMFALNELAQDPDFMAGLVAIGIEIGKVIIFKKEDATLEDALVGWNDSYHAVHRNGDVGQKLCEKIGPQHYKITLTDIYPDDFNYGIMHGFAKRFLPPGTSYRIYYDPDVTPRDRDGTQGMTVIHIQWE